MLENGCSFFVEKNYIAAPLRCFYKFHLNLTYNLNGFTYIVVCLGETTFLPILKRTNIYFLLLFCHS